jgi:hypothetical protein
MFFPITSTTFSGPRITPSQETATKAGEMAKGNGAEILTRVGEKARERNEAARQNQVGAPMQKLESRAERNDRLGKTIPITANRMGAMERLNQNASAAKTNANLGATKPSLGSMQTQSQMRTPQAPDQRAKMMDSMSTMMNRQTNMQNNMMRSR